MPRPVVYKAKTKHDKLQFLTLVLLGKIAKSDRCDLLNEFEIEQFEQFLSDENKLQETLCLSYKGDVFLCSGHVVYPFLYPLSPLMVCLKHNPRYMQ